MKIISWNVNGIRAIMKKDFAKDISKLNPDILCLQETKAHPDQVDTLLTDYEHHFWNSAEKKGYSGTAIFSKIKPLSVLYGIEKEEHDKEGRVITIELKDYYIVNCYTPNSKRGLLRLNYRMKWENDFKNYLKNLEKKKPVILCGDLNVAHNEIDLKNPKTNRKNAGFSDKERAKMTLLQKAGFIDTFRTLHPDKIQYSWWSYMFHARDKNKGWRIDYFIVSNILKKLIKDSIIHDKILGSDHCPVELIL